MPFLPDVSSVALIVSHLNECSFSRKFLIAYIPTCISGHNKVLFISRVFEGIGGDYPVS
jgi:hypothetical protein